MRRSSSGRFGLREIDFKGNPFTQHTLVEHGFIKFITWNPFEQRTENFTGALASESLRWEATSSTISRAVRPCLTWTTWLWTAGLGAFFC